MTTPFPNKDFDNTLILILIIACLIFLLAIITSCTPTENNHIENLTVDNLIVKNITADQIIFTNKLDNRTFFYTSDGNKLYVDELYAVLHPGVMK